MILGNKVHGCWAMKVITQWRQNAIGDYLFSMIIGTIRSRKAAGKYRPQETVQKGLKRSILIQTVGLRGFFFLLPCGTFYFDFSGNIGHCLCLLSRFRKFPKTFFVFADNGTHFPVMKFFTVIVIVQRALWILLRHFYSLFP